MRTKSYFTLKRIAQDEYRNTSAGLSTVRLHDSNLLKNTVEHGQNWSHMNYRETCCHMIGFIDAIVWLGRNDALNVSPKYICFPPDNEFDLEDEIQFSYIGEHTKRLILSLIASFDTGKDIDYCE